MCIFIVSVPFIFSVVSWGAKLVVYLFCLCLYILGNELDLNSLDKKQVNIYIC